MQFSYIAYLENTCMAQMRGQNLEVRPPKNCVLKTQKKAKYHGGFGGRI